MAWEEVLVKLLLLEMFIIIHMLCACVYRKVMIFYTDAKILSAVLQCIGVDQMGQKIDDFLGEQLYKGLFGRKYLIILDDVWSSLVWDKMQRFFPDNDNGSRILVTTRLLDVARSVGSCNPYDIKLLDNNTSWELFSEIVFGEEVCPLELEYCGNKIVRSCNGLPPAITVIGGLLKMSLKTLDIGRMSREMLAPS